jgi:uncharacterized protein (DUF1786 family)
MDFEDFLQPEVGITAVVVAAAASPRVRKVVRRGAVLGLAGLFMAGDAAMSFARNVGQGAQQAAANAAATAQDGQRHAASRGGAHGRGASARHETPVSEGAER